MGRQSLEVLSDTGVGANKSFTVPSDVYYEVLYAHATLVTTATAGTRVMIMAIENASSTVIIDLHAGATVAANQSTPQHHVFLQGIYRETSFANNSLQVPIPKDCFVFPGYSLIFKDENERDLAADTLSVYAVVRKHPN